MGDIDSTRSEEEEMKRELAVLVISVSIGVIAFYGVFLLKGVWIFKMIFDARKNSPIGEACCFHQDKPTSAVAWVGLGREFPGRSFFQTEFRIVETVPVCEEHKNRGGLSKFEGHECAFDTKREFWGFVLGKIILLGSIFLLIPVASITGCRAVLTDKIIEYKFWGRSLKFAPDETKRILVRQLVITTILLVLGYFLMQK